MSEQTTVSPKTASAVAEKIKKAIGRRRIPVIVADQPAIAFMIAKEASKTGYGEDEQLGVNAGFTEKDVVNQIANAALFRKSYNRVQHVVVIKSSKAAAAGNFDGRYFVKIMCNRLYVTMGSLANYLAGAE